MMVDVLMVAMVMVITLIGIVVCWRGILRIQRLCAR